MRRSEGVGEEKDLRFFSPWRLDASVFHKVDIIEEASKRGEFSAAVCNYWSNNDICSVNQY